MKKSILTAFFTIVITLTYSQFFDKYGVRIGCGLSNQKYTFSTIEYKELYEYKISPSIFIGGEHKLDEKISLKGEIGYIQKGFKNNMTFRYDNLENNSQNILTLSNKNINLNDLSTNIGFKISPFQTKFKPYLSTSLRGDYLISYRDITYSLNGNEFGIFKGTLKDYHKLTLGALLGIGVEYKELVFIDFEYNPSITPNFYKAGGLKVHDRYFGLSLGININTLITKKKEL